MRKHSQPLDILSDLLYGSAESPFICTGREYVFFSCQVQHFTAAYGLLGYICYLHCSCHLLPYQSSCHLLPYLSGVAVAEKSVKISNYDFDVFFISDLSTFTQYYQAHANLDYLSGKLALLSLLNAPLFCQEFFLSLCLFARYETAESAFFRLVFIWYNFFHSSTLCHLTICFLFVPFILYSCFDFF